MAWLPASSGYEVSLDRGTVVCRTAAGKRLKRLPAQLRNDQVVVGLRQLAEWLARHEAACRGEVERWLTRSQPVPAELLCRVWPDQAWREALQDLVVLPAGGTEPGFLRGADPARGVGVVDLDGESVWWDARQLLVPHPVHLAELAELREFAVDLEVRQGTLQLFREVWHRPDDPGEQQAALSAYAGGRFAQLRHLTGRATALGYPVRGGYVTCRVWEHGRAVSAGIWVGADEPTAEAETGELTFTDSHGTELPTGDVPPVAWSEGMRMAAALYAGRVTEEAQP